MTSWLRYPGATVSQRPEDACLRPPPCGRLSTALASSVAGTVFGVRGAGRHVQQVTPFDTEQAQPEYARASHQRTEQGRLPLQRGRGAISQALSFKCGRGEFPCKILSTEYTHCIQQKAFLFLVRGTLRTVHNRSRFRPPRLQRSNPCSDQTSRSLEPCHIHPNIDQSTKDLLG